ncbi:MAG: acyl-[ACP]--phospholipid O-acyltransferase [Sulfurovaceae bacterium]|nr:acyl-[ACP]--phospholipid O-acyltransferase [Sulfurovaceae bacterium]
MTSLIKIAGFIPFIIIVFINATVDIAHKITIQNTLLKSFDGSTLIILSALINAMILLPFIFLFSPSGYISDRFSKTKVIRYGALTAIIVSLFIVVSYYFGQFYMAFGLTFLLAAQSAIYSPAKYGMIKELVGNEHLAEANGIVQAISIAAILLSAIVFSVIFEMLYIGGEVMPNNILKTMMPIGWLLVILSTIEWYLSFKLPLMKIENREKHFDFLKYVRFNYFKTNMKTILIDKQILLSMIGLSVFWAIGQLIIAAFPAHYKEVLGDDNAVMIQAILALSAIGIVVGSIIAGKNSKLHIELGLVPLGALGMFAALLMFTWSHTVAAMMLASFIFGFFGGLFIVPLNSLMQFLAPNKDIGVILAGNNFIQNIFMLSFLILSIVLVSIGFSSHTLFLTAAFIALLGTFYLVAKIPHLFVRVLLMPILKMRYRLNIHGLENIPSQGGVLLLGNHISWIDWLLLQVSTPRAIKFVMHKHFYEKWYIRRILDFFDVIPIANIGSKRALDTIRKRLDNGEVVALFPEGRISFNGQMNEFKKGFEKSVAGTNHPIVPFYLYGLWGSRFSKANRFFKSMIRKGDKRDVRVVFGPQLPSNTQAHEVKQHVIELSRDAWEASINELTPITHSWLRWAKARPFQRSIVDTFGNDFNNLKIMRKVFLFAKRLKLLDGENVGVLLSSSSMGAIVNMALLMIGKRPVNINYTLSEVALSNVISQAGMEKIITSKKFMHKLSSEGFNLDHIFGERMIAIEDMSKTISKKEKICTSFEAFIMPKMWLKWRYFLPVSMEDTAVILFVKKGEEMPLGVELTHKNLITNIKQVAALLQFEENDIMLSSLPMFHSFGLSVMTLLPLCEGIGMISISDPSDCTAFGALAARYEATIMFGTSQSFKLYIENKKLHPLMFKNIRIAATGAQKLDYETRRDFKDKFGLDIYEGYGATETSPVIAVNMPDALDLDSMKIVIGNKDGSVGQAIPGTMIKIVDLTTNKTAEAGAKGMILVGGAQVMKGYLDNPNKTNEVIVELDGIRYYKTGNMGYMDKDGFITIVDRY